VEVGFGAPDNVVAIWYVRERLDADPNLSAPLVHDQLHHMTRRAARLERPRPAASLSRPNGAAGYASRMMVGMHWYHESHGLPGAHRINRRISSRRAVVMELSRPPRRYTAVSRVMG